ncbi:MAG: electron transfer flavoprotein subunit beta/FixA family protein, partial [Aquificota bacterium]
MPEAVVCVKPIPDPKYWDRLSLDPKTGVLRREGIPTVINPLDKHALEVALQLKDNFGWEVTVVSMAPP